MSGPLKVDDLVMRAKEGSVSDSELRDVAAILSAGLGGEDTYGLLYVLGRSMALRYEPLVSRFLDYREEPYVARLALQILCSFWDKTEKYSTEVLRFLRGVDWDEFREVRQIAITATGDYLRDRSDPVLLKEILLLADLGNPESIERRIAVESVAVALGEPLGEAINADKGDMSWDDWAATIVARGQDRLISET